MTLNTCYIRKTGLDHGGIGLMVKHDLVDSVMEVKRVCPRIISIDVVENKKVVTVILVYAPQSGRSEEEKFYKTLPAAVQLKHGICFMLDFNLHIGRSFQGYDGIYGEFGRGECNRELADGLDMVIGNTM